MKKILWVVTCLFLASCAEINRETPLTPNDKIIVPSSNAIGMPSEVSVSQLADMIVVALNKSREEAERKEQEKETALREAQKEQEKSQKDVVNQALQTFVDLSKKQGAGEITLFFDKGSDTLEYSYTERDRLVSFLDYLSRESHGRKILLLSIGSASTADTPSNKYQLYGVKEKKTASKIQLSVARAKAPLEIIEKYLVNVPHQTYDAYGVGENKNSRNATLTAKAQEIYQHVRIIATFEKSELPLLPK